MYAWDARGHGDSDRPLYPAAYAWDGFSADLLAVLDALNMTKGVLAVGHSGGAATVVHAELTHPGRFSRVVLLDAIIAPAVFFPTAKPLAVASRRRIHEFASRQAALERLGGKPPMNRWAPEVLDAYLDYGFSRDEAGKLHLKCPGEIEALVYESGGLVDVYGRLGEVNTRALMVTGTQSYMLEHVRDQHQRLPNAELVELPETGHFIPQERPEACAELVRGWFKELA